METGIVYEGVVRGSRDDDAATHDRDAPKLFSGLKLWFSHSVPQRKWLMENAQSNGAAIVPFEQQADIRLVDHARKNQAPGTYSYRFIENSIRTGQLEHLEAHRVGSTARVDRPVGSIVTGPKGSRAAYTEEEDQYLYNFITPFRNNGGAFKGNEIYKQIERLRPRHTYQSWRDRYIKHVQFQSRTITAPVDFHDSARQAAPDEPVEQGQPSQKRPSPTREETSGKRQRTANGVAVAKPQNRTAVSHEASLGDRTPTSKRHRSSSPLLTPDSQREGSLSLDEERKTACVPTNLPQGFESKHFRKFWKATHHILQGPSQGVDITTAFDACAQEENYREHSGHEWRVFWQLHVLPHWLEHRGKTLSDIDPAVLLSLSDARDTPTDQPPAADQVRERASDDELNGISCSVCLIRDSVRWRRDRNGKIFCNDCGIMFKQARLRSISGGATALQLGSATNEHDSDNLTGVEQSASRPQKSFKNQPATPKSRPHYSDAKVQTSPLRSPSSAGRDEKGHDAVQREEPPGPNESRKRSAGRTSHSTSQETNKDEEKITDDQHAPVVDLVRDDLLNDGDIEIPSTPPDNTAAVPVEPHSPHRQPLGELPIPSRESSPLFMPQGGYDPELPSDGRDGNSPLNIRLVENVSSQQHRVAPSSHSDKENLNEEASSEYGDAFEATPEVSQDWETAPEAIQPRERRLSTQVLFQTAESQLDATNFELPAPEGGWDALGVPEVEDDELQAIQETPEVVEISSDLEEEMNIDKWLDYQREYHPGVKGLEGMMMTAIASTSFDFAIAAQVVDLMVEFSKTNAGRRLRRQGKIPLPDDVSGCWTEADDNLLLSAAQQDLDTVVQKHGEENCKGRLEFLEAYETA